jgi:hypothetical protein
MSEDENVIVAFPTLDVGDISSCEEYVKRLFECVVKFQGEDVARRIFGPYGRPRTKRQIKLQNDAALLGEYYLECLYAEESKGKPNVRKLARRLAKENNTDPGALERKIWRVIKDKKVRRYMLEADGIVLVAPDEL